MKQATRRSGSLRKCLDLCDISKAANPPTLAALESAWICATFLRLPTHPPTLAALEGAGGRMRRHWKTTGRVELAAASVWRIVSAILARNQ